MSPFSREKHHILPHFQLQRCVMAPPSDIERKLNAGTQLQTFPYPRSFVSSNGLMLMLCSQTSPFKSVTVKKNTRKTKLFCSLTECDVDPHQTLHCDGRDPYNFYISKTFSHPAYSFTARGCSEFGGNAHPEVEPPLLWNPTSEFPKFKWLTLAGTARKLGQGIYHCGAFIFIIL